MSLNELGENSQATVTLGKFVNNPIIKLSLACSFQKMFFIGQKLKHVHMTYYFLELLIFFWLALVGIYRLEFISYYIKEILHVNPAYTGNQSLNKNKDIYFHLSLILMLKNPVLLMLSKNSLSTVSNFSQFHEHNFLKVMKHLFCSSVNFKRFLIKKCPCCCVPTIFLNTF